VNELYVLISRVELVHVVKIKFISSQDFLPNKFIFLRRTPKRSTICFFYEALISYFVEKNDVGILNLRLNFSNMHGLSYNGCSSRGNFIPSKLYLRLQIPYCSILDHCSLYSKLITRVIQVT